MFRVNNKDIRTTPRRCSGVFIVNFEHSSHLVLVFLFLTLSRYISAGYKEVFYKFFLQILLLRLRLIPARRDSG